MAFIPADQVIRTEMIYSWGGQIVENVLHWLSSEPVSEIVITTLLEAMEEWFNDFLSTDVSNEISLTEIKGTDLTAAGSFVVEHFPTSPIPGDAATPSVPNNSTLAIKLTTLGSGRSARGRNYLCGLVDANTNGSTEYQATPTAELIVNYLEFLDTPFTPDYELSVVSFYHLGAPRVSGLVQPVIGIGADLFLDSQRRRLAGRGQ